MGPFVELVDELVRRVCTFTPLPNISSFTTYLRLMGGGALDEWEKKRVDDEEP